MCAAGLLSHCEQDYGPVMMKRTMERKLKGWRTRRKKIYRITTKRELKY